MLSYEENLSEVKQTLSAALDLNKDFLQDLIRVSSLSDYFYHYLKTNAAIELIDSGDLFRSYLSSRPVLFHASSMEKLSADGLDVELRRVRHREMCRIIFRDITRRAELIETTLDLSVLAEACIEAALVHHYKVNVTRYGLPTCPLGKPQQMSVLALGKLGASELNLSSDIDLIFFYGEAKDELSAGTGAGAGGELSASEISSQEFFIRTSRKIIKSLDTVLSDGFVFRVDMRLRPYGESSPLIVHRAFLEKYYVEQGRDWERYAFIKARAVAGNIALGEEFLKWLRPFVYRKQLDYGAVESLREMKGLINYEVERKELIDDIKLGPGGIREVEFVVQAHQLVWGGRTPELQERRLFEALSLLEKLKLIPDKDAEDLRQAYIYLRNAEHAIQAEKDRQTQKLPSELLSQQRLANIMGESNYPLFLACLQAHRDRVSACFANFMGSNKAEKEILIEVNLFWATIWREPLSEESLSLLSEHGFEDFNKTAAYLKQFKDDQSKLPDLAANRLRRLMPLLLSLCARELNPSETLKRSLAILDAVTRRSTYLVFLLENMDAMKRLIHLCGMSSWVAQRVAAHPILLYEFTDKSTDTLELSRLSLKQELDQIIANLPEKDLEAQMDGLRQFKHAAVLRAAVLELLNLLPTMKASDYLTTVAEIVLDKATDLAFDYLIDRHGEPCDRAGTPQGRCFVVIAYGKFGGIELAYGSDLDIVFLHDADIQGETQGEKPLPNNVFFSRLGQRIVHIMSSLTSFGLLYEIDLRLRPDGNKGPLVGTFNAFERYLAQAAWTWEYQALVRARFVAGNPEFREKFEEIRRKLITAERDEGQLRADVIDMRGKMRRHLDKEKIDQEPTQVKVLETMLPEFVSESFDLKGLDLKPFDLKPFDLKHSAGAIIDIEFLVQYLVLANGHRFPELATRTDKVRLIALLADRGLISKEESETLRGAYIAYRSAVHYTWLGGQMFSYEQLNLYREQVVLIWQRHLSA